MHWERFFLKQEGILSAKSLLWFILFSEQCLNNWNILQTQNISLEFNHFHFHHFRSFYISLHFIITNDLLALSVWKKNGERSVFMNSARIADDNANDRVR